MRVRARTVGRVNIPKDKCIVLDHAYVREEDYSGRQLFQFCTIGSRLEACRFDRARIAHAQLAFRLFLATQLTCFFRCFKATQSDAIGVEQYECAR